MTKTVLVIEDDPDLNFLYTSILEHGYDVDSALDGTEGMQKLSRFRYDAVLLDLHLPDISGEEIYAILEERGDADRVLICSADARLVQNYIMQGVNAVTKPIPMALLNSLVSRVVEGVPLVGGFL